MLVIELTDTGIGLPEDRDRLTEPYMTTRVRGTGLGLAIVKKIVEEHGGEIAFLDRSGGGTLVRIAFDKTRLQTLAEKSGDADPEEWTDASDPEAFRRSDDIAPYDDTNPEDRGSNGA